MARRVPAFGAGSVSTSSILVVLIVAAQGVWWGCRQRRSRAHVLVDAAAGLDDRLRRRRSRRRSERRDARRVAAELPRLAEAIARDVRAGASVAEALVGGSEVVGGVVAADLGAVGRALGSGASMADALGAWRDRRAVPALDQFVGTVLIGAELGGRAAGALEGVAVSLRDQAEVLDEVRALTSQSRASAALLTGLPPLAATGLAVIEPETARFLSRTTAGLSCLAVASALVVAGWWWMDRLCRFDR